jgi:anti-sigma regulatory factor (Ser/Thr protein kinase)
MTAPFVASEQFPAELSTPAAARRFVVRSLRAAGVTVDDGLPVVVSELVTNSVLHASSTTQVRVHVGEQVVRVEVHDTDPTLPVLRRPAPDTVTGRGLVLVDALSDRWGAEGNGDGKVVWFELDR